MRCTTLLALGAIAVAAAVAGSDPATAGGANRDGYGIYSPLEPPQRYRPRAYRYDPRSWYYKQRGYYSYYDSGYWVPRAEMRYRYRYTYVGPKYPYLPAWGYAPR